MSWASLQSLRHQNWNRGRTLLRIFADRAFPELHDEAREKAVLGLILEPENSQIAFNV